MEKPLFCCYIPGEEKQIFPGTSLWAFPLSGKHAGFSGDRTAEHMSEASVITIGDYFSASQRFLSDNDFLILKKGLETASKGQVSTDQIKKIIIFLEKHGAFYHPLKVQVELTFARTSSFVLNGAVSAAGLALIEDEFHCISRLTDKVAHPYLPKVFGVGTIKTEKGNVGFFLGEWLDGYKEFHATENGKIRQFVIWESDGTCHYLPQSAALPIYQETARIMTYYYNIETFEQIFPWHHAAGDFVVKKEDDNLYVRLITVRGYSTVMEYFEPDTDKRAHILPALLVFFLNLSLRNRLDRLDGTGKTILLGKGTITATVNGFLQALDEKSRNNNDYGDLRFIFIDFFKQFSMEQIMGGLENILDSCPLNSSEMVLIEGNLEFHSQILCSIFKSL